MIFGLNIGEEVVCTDKDSKDYGRVAIFGGYVYVGSTVYETALFKDTFPVCDEEITKIITQSKNMFKVGTFVNATKAKLNIIWNLKEETA